MSGIDISTPKTILNTGVLQLQNGVAMSATLTNVADQNNTTSPLLLSTSLVQTLSTLKITTADNPYIDAEDNSGNNRFTIGRDPASQQVNLDFASNPTGSTTNVGAIRTYVDGTNLFEVVTFREDGNVQIGSTSASAVYWDNTNNRLGIGLNTPVAGPFQVKTTQSNANGSIIFSNNSAATILAATDTGSALTLLQFRADNYNFADATNGVLIGGTYGSTPTARLQIKGSGSTSATTSLLVQNSAGSTALQVTDDRVISCSYQLTGPLLRASSNLACSTFQTQNYAGIWMTVDDNTNFGNVNFGTVTANASARVQVDSTTKGFLPPRMTTAEKNAIATPAAGLVVYDTTLNKLCVYTTAWETITSV